MGKPTLYTEPDKAFEALQSRIVERFQAQPELFARFKALPPEEQARAREGIMEKAKATAEIVISPEREERVAMQVSDGGLGPQTIYRTKKIPAVTRPLYDRGTENLIKAWREGEEDVVDWQSMDFDTLMQTGGFLEAAVPERKQDVLKAVQGRAREILEARGMTGDSFAAEFGKRGMAFAGAAAAGMATDAIQWAADRSNAVMFGMEPGETKARNNEWNRLTRENRELARLAYGDELQLAETAGLILSWAGGANAVLRRGIGVKMVPQVDPKTGAKVLDKAGNVAMRRAPFAVDPLSRRGLAEMAVYDTATGFAVGPEYIGGLAQALGMPESRLTSAAEAGTLGLAVGTALRAGSNMLLANKVRQMPGFEDLAERFTNNREFMRAAADRLEQMAARQAHARAQDRMRRSAEARRQGQTTESMGGEFVGDVADARMLPGDAMRAPVPDEAVVPYPAPARPRVPEVDAEAGLRVPGEVDEGFDAFAGLRAEGQAPAVRGAPDATVAGPTRVDSLPASGVETPAPASPEMGSEASKAPAKPKVKRSIAIPPRPDGVFDVIDALSELGGIRPLRPGDGGEYDGYKEVMNYGVPRLLRRKGASPVDIQLLQLREMGFEFQTADELWDAISEADSSRRALKQSMKEARPEIDYKGQVHNAFLGNDGRTVPQRTNTPVEIDTLSVGDKFKIKGEDFEVKDIDPDTMARTVEDGMRFEVEPGTAVWVDRGLVEARPFVKDPFDPDAAEYVRRAVEERKVFDAKVLKNNKLPVPEGYFVRKGKVIPRPKPGEVRKEAPAGEAEALKAGGGDAPVARPYTPEEAAAEAAGLEAQAARRKQQEAIEAGLERPLTGDSSDVGQGRLFEEDVDLFSGPAGGGSRASYGDAPGAEGRPGGAGPAYNPGASPEDVPRFMLELPELVEMVRWLTEGGVPRILSLFKRKPGRLGQFVPSGPGRIDLKANLFSLVTEQEKAALREQAAAYAKAQAEAGAIDPGEVMGVARERYRYLLDEMTEARMRTNPEQALKTLSHEIGHLVDYLPERMIAGRGNLFGRIASMKNMMRRYMPKDPNAPAGEPLTQKERAALRKEAKRQLDKELGPLQEVVRKILVEEPEWATTGITPDDVTRLLGMSAREDMPELYEWFAIQSAAVKKEILKKALKGLVDERLAGMGSRVQVGSRTVEKTVIERSGRNPTKTELEERFRKLLHEEIERRNLAALADVRAEMKALSEWWRGSMGPEGSPYYRYRMEGAELYADAVSVMLVNPPALAQRAPGFYEMFFNYLHRKPEVKRVYEQIQDDLRSGNVQRERVKRLRGMFDRANANLSRVEEMAGKPSMKEVAEWVDFYVDRSLGPIYRRANRLGDPAAKDRVVEALENFKYSESQFELFLRQVKFGVFDAVKPAGLEWPDVAEFIFLRRLTGDRANLANPGGWTAKNALERLDELEATLRPEQWKALNDAAASLRRAWVDNVLEPLKRSGALDDELMQNLEENVFYATFRVVRDPGPLKAGSLESILARKFGGTESAGIFRQVGTLQDIEDPLSAMLMKGRQIIRFAYRNMAAREVTGLLNAVGDSMFGPAKFRWVEQGGRGRRVPVRVNNLRVGTLTYMHKGKLQAHYVPRVVAEAFANPDSTVSLIMLLPVMATALAKGLFTRLNPGFWPWSLFWDSWGWVNRMPGVSMAVGDKAYLKYAPRAAKAAWDLQYGKPNALADEALRNLDLISRAYYRGERLPGMSNAERLLISYGLSPALPKDASEWKKLEVKLSEFLERVLGPSQIQERIPKIAGRMMLNEHYVTTDEAVTEGRKLMRTGEQKQLIHQQAGSPDYLSKGAGANFIDMFFRLFFNPMKEGWRSKAKQMKERPGEAAAKFALYTGGPATMIWAIEQGYLNDELDALFGAGVGEEYQAMLQSIGEREKTNHYIIPIRWYDKEAGKVLYLRMPLEPNERTLNAAWRKVLTEGEGGTGITQYFGDAVGGDNPFRQVVRANWDYHMRGINPFDSFYRRNVLTQDQMEAKEGTVPLLKWSFNQFFGTLVGRLETTDRLPTEPDPEGLEKLLKAPFVGPTLGRWLRISNAGLRDQALGSVEGMREYDAKLRLAGWDILRRIMDDENLSESQWKLMEEEPYLREWINRKGREMQRLHSASPELRILLRDARSNRERVEIMKRFDQRPGR